MWLWWLADPARLSTPARTAIERSEGIGISAISCFEVAGLVRRGRIELDRSPEDWIRTGLAAEGTVALPIVPEVAVAAALLPATFPGDPADRLIYAAARANRAVVVTKDKALRAFDPQLTLW